MMIGLRRVVALVFLAVVCVGGVAGTSVPSTASAAAGDDEAGLGRMVLLLDSSGSMAEPAGGGQSKIEAARTALHTVIEGLPDQAQVGLRVFGAKVFSRTDKGACTDSQLVVPPGTDNRADLSAAVGKYKPYGETPIPYALQQAAKDLGEEGARSIVLVSDGESTCDPDPCKVAADLEKGGIDLQIDVVGLSVSGAARDQLRCIAEAGNGHYYDADSAGDIESRLARVASRAVRPFTLTGQPITGGPENDPTPITVGDWIDTLAGSGATKSYVFERQTADTTIRAAAITQGAAEIAEGFNLTIYGPDDARCDYARLTRLLDTRMLMGVEASAAPSTEGETSTTDCGAPGQYRITVSRGPGADGVVPFGLRVSEEPPLADAGYEPPAGSGIQVTPPQVSGSAQKVDGGASFANATEIGAGRWSSTVVPGEALLYRIPLEFGQAARVSVKFAQPHGATADAFGRFPPLAGIRLFDPMQGGLSYPDDATFSETADGATLTTATAPVSRVPTELPTKFDGGGDYTTAGDYYLMVVVEPEDYTIELPITIDVEVVGDAAAGPTYAGGATWSVATGASGGDGSTESPSGETSPTSEPTEDPSASGAGSSDDDSSATTLVAAGLGAAGLAAVVVALLLWRRRQAA